MFRFTFNCTVQSNNLVKGFSTVKLLKLNDLQHVPGSFKKAKRVGRGVGSGLGKTSGHGHQFSRVTPLGFEGGQTPIYQRLPKIGFTNFSEVEHQPLSLQKIQEWVATGRLAPPKDTFLTIRDLYHSGIVSSVKDGIKLLSNGKEKFDLPIHFEVSAASKDAIEAIEKAGGTVTCIHLNKLAIRAMLKPYDFELYPMRARPTPKVMQFYLTKENCGYLAPEIQTRNLKLFGSVTSETKYREEHNKFMAVQREIYRQEREQKIEYLKKKVASKPGYYTKTL